MSVFFGFSLSGTTTPQYIMCSKSFLCLVCLLYPRSSGFPINKCVCFSIQRCLFFYPEVSAFLSRVVCFSIQRCLLFYPEVSAFLSSRVSDPHPDPHGSALIWVAGSGSGSAFKKRIRIRIQEGKNDPKNRKKYRIFKFWSAGCSLLRAEGFSCSLGVLYGALGIGKL